MPKLLSKAERLREIEHCAQHAPDMTPQDLAERCGVNVAVIRKDLYTLALAKDIHSRAELPPADLELDRQRDWINIAERTPEHNQRVMVWDNQSICPKFAKWFVGTFSGAFVVFANYHMIKIQAVWWLWLPPQPV